MDLIFLMNVALLVDQQREGFVVAKMALKGCLVRENATGDLHPETPNFDLSKPFCISMKRSLAAMPAHLIF